MERRSKSFAAVGMVVDTDSSYVVEMVGAKPSNVVVLVAGFLAVVGVDSNRGLGNLAGVPDSEAYKSGRTVFDTQSLGGMVVFGRPVVEFAFGSVSVLVSGCAPALGCFVAIDMVGVAVDALATVGVVVVTVVD